MAEDNSETEKRVNWVVPLAQRATLGDPSVSVLDAAAKRGIQIENVRKDEDGRLVADVVQKVVEGMPAPKR